MEGNDNNKCQKKKYWKQNIISARIAENYLKRMIEAKIIMRWSCNSFSGQLNKHIGTVLYKNLKEIATERLIWRNRITVNNSMGWTHEDIYYIIIIWYIIIYNLSFDFKRGYY